MGRQEHLEVVWSLMWFKFVTSREPAKSEIDTKSSKAAGIVFLQFHFLANPEACSQETLC